ncbi:MAG: hypothetical protein IT210_18530 [Armatimonadetes bacterium]|nr:hypothetical protein [Armatimonadota bacterium]
MIFRTDRRPYWIATLWLASLIPVSSQAPDLLALLRQSGAGADVTFCYPGVVSHTRARQHLEDLIRRTGWAVSGVRISDESPLASGASPLTGVSFHVRTLVPGPLPALAMAETFRRMTSLRLIFMMAPGTPFQGPYPYEDRHVRVAGESAGSTHSYTITIKDAAFERLTAPLPAAGAGAAPAADTAPVAGPRPRLWLGLGLAAVGLALVAYWAADRYRRRPISRGGKKTW